MARFTFFATTPAFDSPSRLVFLISCALVSICVAAESRSVWDGVFTKEQAARGNTIYRQECMRCHSENLLGSEDAAALVGEDFLGYWNSHSVGELFDQTRRTMPTDGPGGLSRRQYIDVIAYILSANRFPAGDKELEPDLAALKEIKIQPKK